jgi:muramoyltetrapeptide carboxypeptidase
MRDEAFLQPGDRVRLVSPSSAPDREAVARFSAILEGWGLAVDVGPHAFDRLAFLAGTDEHRAADLNDALRDPATRAVFTTRGGKGAYRIADRLDFDAARRDPKPLVGFSDATVLQLALWKHARAPSVHGPDASWAASHASPTSVESLRAALMEAGPVVLHADPRAETAALTTRGQAAGVLLGGNLDLIATAAGWALPSFADAILLLEDVDRWLGHLDRVLTMLVNGSHLRGVRGVAVGHFTRCLSAGEWSYLDVLRDRLGRLGVPILGGLPVGHDPDARAVPLGAAATLDTAGGTLTITRNYVFARP